MLQVVFEIILAILSWVFQLGTPMVHPNPQPHTHAIGGLLHKPVAILCAMPEEVAFYLDTFAGQQNTIKHAGMTFHCGQLQNQDVVVVQCGVGKVHAAMCTQIVLDQFQARAILFSGVAGALATDLEIGDIIISTDCVQHDMDVTALGFAPGQIPWTDWIEFECSVPWITACTTAAIELGLRARTGRVLSADQFVSDPQRVDWLKETFRGDCVEMEAGAVGQVCKLNNNAPYLTIRAISDKADHSSPVDFPSFCQTAAVNSAQLILQVLKNL